MKIPSKMSNEQSKLIASVVCLQREIAVLDGKLFGIKNRYEKEYGPLAQ